MRMSSRSPVVFRLVLRSRRDFCLFGWGMVTCLACVLEGETALREFEVQPNGYEPRSLFLALLRDCRFFGVAGVQDHREEAGPGLATRIPGHPVHRSRRLVERIPGLVGLDRLVVEGVLVFALQDVAEHRAGMAVRGILFVRPRS